MSSILSVDLYIDWLVNGHNLTLLAWAWRLNICFCNILVTFDTLLEDVGKEIWILLVLKIIIFGKCETFTIDKNI